MQAHTTRCPFFAPTEYRSTSVGLAMVPFTVVFNSTFIASGASLFGSFSMTSARSPTTNTRGLLTPNLLTARTSYGPGGTSGATVILNLLAAGTPFLGGGGGSFFFGSGFGSGGGGTTAAVIPGWLKRSLSVSSRSVPMTVSSATPTPALAPGGLTVSRRGSGSPGCCWAWAIWATAATAHRAAHRRNRHMG